MSHTSGSGTVQMYSCVCYKFKRCERPIPKYEALRAHQVQLKPIGFCTWLHGIARLPVVTIWSKSTNLRPGQGAAPLHFNDPRVPDARFPVIGPQVMSEIWKSEVSQPPVAPEKVVHWVIWAAWVVTLTRVKSQKAVLLR